MQTDSVLVQSPVEVRVRNGQAGLYAARAFAPGELVMRLTGTLCDAPDRYSIQIGPGRHLSPAPTPGDEEEGAWRFLNHGCDPNVEVDVEGRRIVALRAVAAGEELRFDYNTTEWEMAEPFACTCGAAGCYGTVAGFRHLSPERQRMLRIAGGPYRWIYVG